MSRFIRFMYVSTSSALPATIREHLIQISKMAESFSAEGKMFGVLVYGNGYYLHCIEAPESIADEVWRIAQTSTLNFNVRTIRREVISAQARCFDRWTIKYFISEPAMQQFFAAQGWEKFDPYLLKDQQIDDFFRVLANYTEDISLEKAQQRTLFDSASEVAIQHQRMNVLAYGFAVLTLVVGVTLLFYFNR